jgi:hypothetical protein
MKVNCNCACHQFKELKWILHRIHPCQCKQVKIKSAEVKEYLKHNKKPNNLK